MLRWPYTMLIHHVSEAHNNGISTYLVSQNLVCEYKYKLT